MGGLIGQALAHRKPGLIDRLVLANSACRLDDDARPTVRRFERYARECDWASIRSELAAALFSDGHALAYPLMVQTVGRVLQPRPAKPADVWRSLDRNSSGEGSPQSTT
jgi:pimeloyl-ACP methyl ester carboxylesterase